MEPEQHRTVLNGTRFSRIGQQQNDMLVGAFTEAEIRVAVWIVEAKKVRDRMV